ncbi:hypothetical protein [Allosphingosinicella vermicomposti]|uniref:hypothetical protein n=1 Tax=Allosphingosinicella vermicomposti TaxID=614671 RepID=UPI000D0F4A1C|nr:hypothetical protein [Allosphingosinicella vermicomposti]
MKLPVFLQSTHPAIASDRAFFAANPRRRFRARKFSPNELGFPDNCLLFAPGENGEIGELDLVILQQIERGRLRWHFVKPLRVSLNTDAEIEAFLRSRGICPVRRKRLRRRA